MALRRIFIYIAILFLAGVLGANVYNSIVDAPNWGSAIPQSLEATKGYFANVNPGNFYRFASPLAQISALLALFAAWPIGKSARILAASALVFAVLGDAFTFL